MTTVGFKPWKGERYEQGYWGKRLLLLGESHYIDSAEELADVSRTTIAVIESQYDPNGGRHAFFTHIAKTFICRSDELTLEDREDFWSRVSFYNYVQQSVGHTARIPPTREMWDASEASFLAVLEELKPDVVIAFGYRLFANMPLCGYEGKPVSQGAQRRTWFYPYDSGSALTYNVLHPSSGRYSSAAWHQSVREAVEMAPRNIR